MTIKGEISAQHLWEGVCLGSLELRTNGPQGGDAGHGGFLELTFTNSGSTRLDVSVNGTEFEAVDFVKLKFCGDAEMEIALECFEFLAAKLKAIREIES